MENNEFETVTLLDEDDKECVFEHIITFLYEGERYVALSPIDQAEEDEAEVILLKIVQSDGEDTYVTIDNEVLLNEVFGAFLEIMDEQEDGEEE